MKWKDVNGGDLVVALSWPCENSHQLARGARYNCCLVDSNHGHLRMACEDGGAVVPFPIRSQAGFKALLQKLEERGSLKKQQGEADAIWELLKDSGIPENLDEAEREIFADSAKLEQATNFAFFGV